MMNPRSEQVIRTSQSFSSDITDLDNNAICMDMGRRSCVKGQGCLQVERTSQGPWPLPSCPEG